MVWRPGRNNQPGIWSGPLKVVVQENAQTIWTTGASKLFRSTPEHVRPVTAAEAREIPASHNEPPVSIIAKHIPWNTQQGTTRAIDCTQEFPISSSPQVQVNNPDNSIPPNNTITINTNESTSEGQPDVEPEVPIQSHTHVYDQWFTRRT